MSNDPDPVRKLRELFEQQACLEIDPMAKALALSIPSVRRYLVIAGYCSSFTHNGRWYTLASIPSFNHEGLWFHEKIGFSRNGNLTRTLVHLVNRSVSGMTAEQLGDKTQCRCHAILVNLHRRGLLQREKVGRCYVYLSDAPEINCKQQTVIAQRKAASLPPIPAEIAVLILAEFIRQPASTFNQLSSALAHQTRMKVMADQIEDLFEHHGLKKTKRMPDTML